MREENQILSQHVMEHFVLCPEYASYTVVEEEGRGQSCVAHYMTFPEVDTLN